MTRRGGRRSGRRGGLEGLRNDARTQLWPVPVAGVVLAVAAGVGLPRLDGALDGSLPAWSADALFGGGPDAARTVLEAIASSLITVTSLTFSLTVVTLQLASSQFSPRLLRTFTRDRFVHVTLAVFLTTFTFALTVLRTVRSAGAGGAVFVPRISVTAAFLLTLASVVALVLFLAHLATEIRVETMLRRVHEDARATADRVLPADRPPSGPLPPVPAHAVHLLARTSGFLQQVDEDRALAAVVEAGAVVLVERPPGSSLVAGTPLGLAWHRTAPQLAEEARAALEEALDDAVVVGAERTEVQDVAFGLRQLTDVATKALSPGINDPTTAIHALGHSSALLCALAGRSPGPRVLRDDDGRVRVVLVRPDLADLVDLAVAQPRRYGASDPTVLARLLTLLREVAWCCREQDRRSVAAQLLRMRGTLAEQGFDAGEAAALAQLAGQVEDALAGRWSPAAG